jgi:hypothetical protein
MKPRPTFVKDVVVSIGRIDKAVAMKGDDGSRELLPNRLGQCSNLVNQAVYKVQEGIAANDRVE